MLIVPNFPAFLLLPIGRLWNGERSKNTNFSSFAELQKIDEGLLIKTTVLFISGSKKELEEKTSLFLVDDDGQYLEADLMIGGKFLITGFDRPNQKVADFNNFSFKTNHKESSDKIINEIIIPNDLLPSKLSALNAFFITNEQILAYYPLPGSEPNIHQPESFPLAKME